MGLEYPLDLNVRFGQIQMRLHLVEDVLKLGRNVGEDIAGKNG